MSQPPPLGTAWRNLSLEQRAALPVGTCLRMSADEDDYHLWLDAAPRWTDADGRVDDPVDRAVIESYPALGPEECGEIPVKDSGVPDASLTAGGESDDDILGMGGAFGAPMAHEVRAAFDAARARVAPLAALERMGERGLSDEDLVRDLGCARAALEAVARERDDALVETGCLRARVAELEAAIECDNEPGPEEGGWCGEHPMRVERDTAGMLGYDTSDGADLCLACEVERLRGIEATARKVVAVCESDASSHQQRRLMIQALRVALAGGTPK